MMHNSSLTSSNSRLIQISFSGIVIGFLLILQHQPMDSSSLLGKLGEAVLISSLVAIVFERLLSQERLKEIVQVIREHNRLQDFGFRDAYVNRQAVFDEFLGRRLDTVKHDLKILGICVSLFREADRGKLSVEIDSKKVSKRISELLVNRKCVIKVLCLKRYPSQSELEAYSLQGGDLYNMRENDEDQQQYLLRGRLKRIANRSIAEWIGVYLEVAERVKDRRATERAEILQRLQIREYIAMPSLSLYVIDDEIFVTPYLYRRRCSDVPAFRIGDWESRLYKAYHEHFERLWNDDLTSEGVSQRFVQLLADLPDDTIRQYRQLCKDIAVQANPANTERESVEERAAKACVDRLDQPRH